MIAVLYVDPLGGYPKLEGVDVWDQTRDARRYAGPHPVIAHPPCGPWGKLAHLCTKQDPSLAPLAVEQVVRWGGVLEHPVGSALWSHCRLPAPGGLPQVREVDGVRRMCWSIQVKQVEWGHKCVKDTLLFIAGLPLPPRFVPPYPGRKASHVVSNFHVRDWPDRPPIASAEIRRRTPRAFADALLELAAQCTHEVPAVAA